MGYVGATPAAKALTSADITDGIIIDADIKSDAAIAMSKTALVGGTGLTLSTNTLNVDAAQTGITSVGTIGTGTWEGTTVAVAQGGTGATTLNNLITLSTHTTGNYAATITAGTGLTSSGATSGEGIAHSLSVDASQSQITTVGALNAGSITSGFTSIDVGSGGLTTTGAIAGGTIDATTDFTIGTTVITDDVITFTPTASDTVTMTADTNGAFSLVTVDANAAAANIIITADGTVDINSAGLLTLDSGAAINIEPASGSAILLDGTISIDGGVVTGATSITSTAFVGDITGDVTGTSDTATVATTVTITDNESTNESNAIIFTAGGDVDGGNIGLESDGDLTYNPSTGKITATGFIGALTGNASGTAATVTGGTQASITSAANLVTVGTIGTGVWQGTAIASGYIAADAITGAKIADDAIDSEHYTDGSIDNAHIADDAIDSEHYADGSIDNAHIADDAIDSEHYAAASIDFAHIQNVAANSILGRNANSSGVLSEVALTTTQILIGDGTGFTAAALSGDATMTNAGVVSITAAQTGITSVYNTSLKMGRDSQNLIDFATTDNKIILRVNNVDEVELVENALSPVTASGVDLGTASLEWGNIYIGDDKKLYLGTGSDASLEYDEDGTDQLRISGATVFDSDMEIADSKFVEFASAAGTPTTDNKVQGIVIEFLAVEAITQFDAVYVSTTTGRVGRADANDAGKMPVIGIAIEAQGSAGSSVRVLTHGVYRDDGGFGGNMTVGVDLYAPETPGTLTTTIPADDGDLIQVIGVATGVRSAFINPSLDVIEHA